MSLRNLFSDSIVKKLRARLGRTPQPVSMVLLLRRSISLSKVNLSAAVENAWNISLADPDTDNFVTQSGDKGLIYIKPHFIGLLNSPKPYLNLDPNKHARTLPQPSQQEAWREHHAWISLDYLKGNIDPELEYSVLARLASRMLDDNCTGLYIPQESSLIPHDPSLLNTLEQLAVKTLDTHPL